MEPKLGDGQDLGCDGLSIFPAVWLPRYLALLGVRSANFAKKRLRVFGSCEGTGVLSYLMRYFDMSCGTHTDVVFSNESDGKARQFCIKNHRWRHFYKDVTDEEDEAFCFVCGCYHDQSLETSSQELMQHPPWEAITHWIRTVTHGGHLGDCWHRQQIYALIERFLGPAAEALKRDCAEGLEAEDMSELELQRARNLCQYLDFQLKDHTPPGKEAWRYLDQLPEAPAELFGLHPREDRVFDSHSSIAMLATLAQIRPPSEDVAAAAAVELKQHLKVEEMLNELPKSSEKLKQELLKPSKTRSRRSLERSEQQDPFHGDPPIAQVLRQELWSLLELVAFLRADLQQIRDMLVSKLELSPEMHEVLRNIFNNTVPTRWRQRAFLSCRPLQGWFIGLKIRLQWLHAAWSERGHEPLCHRLDFYWHPRQLLLSYLRVAAQKDNVALEAYSFRHKVVDRMEEEEDVQDRPAVGLYCVGLYLYGAQWDRKRAILAECRADELFYRMPVIHFIPMADFKPKLEKTYAVPFYQAERQCRITGDGEDSNYITEVLLHSNNSPKDWLLRSVALYCELMA